MIYTIGRARWTTSDIWARFIATQVDLAILAWLPSTVLLPLMPSMDSPPSRGSVDPVALIVVLGLFAALSTLLLSTIGSTPGKTIMGIQVREADGTKLSFDRALSRQLSLVLFGFGLGIPLVSLATAWVSFDRLSAKGVTKWDESLSLSVDRLPVGQMNWIFAIAIWMCSAFLSVMIASGALSFRSVVGQHG